MATALTACSKQAATPDTTTDQPSSGTMDVAGGNPAAEKAAQQIQGDYMRGIVAEISDDRYEGRGPGTSGDVAARKYLAEQLAALGLQPGAEDGSWEQPFDLVGINSSQPKTWTFNAKDESLALKQWDQFIVGSGVQEERAAITDAELVFVGYGIQAPEYDWDDYKGADLKGKWPDW